MKTFRIVKLGADGKARVRLLSLFLELDTTYVPPVSSLTNLEAYCDKLLTHAEVYLLQSRDEWGEDCGLLALYANDTSGGCGYVSSIGVKPTQRGCGAGRLLLEHAVEVAQERGMQRLRLEVHQTNESALRLYRKQGFTEIAAPAVHAEHGFIVLEKALVANDSSTRDTLLEPPRSMESN